MTATEDRFRHAVGATKVATISHGNPQVVKWAGEGIYEVWQGSKALWLRFLLKLFRVGLGMPVEEWSCGGVGEWGAEKWGWKLSVEESGDGPFIG